MRLLQDCPWAVDATLWAAGIDLAAVPGLMSPLRCANILASSPNGAPVWREIGGWKALTDVEAASVQNVYAHSMAIWAAGASKGSKAPEPPKPPVGLIEQRKTHATRQARFDERAAEWTATLDEGGRELIEQRLAAWGQDWRGSGAQSRQEESARRLAAWATPPAIEQ